MMINTIRRHRWLTRIRMDSATPALRLNAPYPKPPSAFRVKHTELREFTKKEKDYYLKFLAAFSRA